MPLRHGHKCADAHAQAREQTAGTMPLTIAYRPVLLPEPAFVASPCASATDLSAPFRATLPRRAPSLRARLARPQRLRAAGLAGVVLAAGGFGPLGWDGALIEPATARAPGTTLAPFETPGENFPGSAFYYLAPDSGVVDAAAPSQPDRAVSPAARPLDWALGDAVARPTYLAGTAQDRLRALQCLTTAIYYEAATEPDAGQRAVAQVVLNRVAHPSWPNSVCGVVYQGSERPGCQFSFACDGSLARSPARMWWLRARDVAEAALAGQVYAPAGLATHYHTSAVNPGWASRLGFIGMIGAHRFYRNLGIGGLASAFSDRYFGGEPVPAPRPRTLTPLTPTSDPLVLAEAYVGARADAIRHFGVLGTGVLGAGLSGTGPSGGAYAVPVPVMAAPTSTASDSLPNASGIRPEYRNSGRWIAQPKG